MNYYLYLFKTKDNSIFKIGISNNPETRFNDVKYESKLDLDFNSSLKFEFDSRLKARALEKFLHTFYDKFNYRNKDKNFYSIEWFDVSCYNDVLKVIEFTSIKVESIKQSKLEKIEIDREKKKVLSKEEKIALAFDKLENEISQDYLDLKDYINNHGVEYKLETIGRKTRMTIKFDNKKTFDFNNNLFKFFNYNNGIFNGFTNFIVSERIEKEQISMTSIDLKEDGNTIENQYFDLFYEVRNEQFMALIENLRHNPNL